MAKYRAKDVLYVNGHLIKKGDVFESNEPPGSKWESLDALAKTQAVEIPDNWRELQDSQRINLARRLGAPVKGTGTAEADAKIEAELTARAEREAGPLQTA